jgi:hypothetical protein
MDKPVTITNLSIQVTRPGFEPRPSEPESEILPLYYRAMLERKCIAINISEKIEKRIYCSRLQQCKHIRKKL